MQFCSLGSGSEGNALLVECAPKRYVLLDCGFRLKELDARLAARGLSTDNLSAVLVTHEHGDHIGSALPLVARARIPLFTSHGTALAVDAASHAGSAYLQEIADGASFTIEGLQINAFSVPHDAREPLQFTLSDGARKLAMLTDLGHATAYVLAQLKGCHSLVLECNHDAALLANGPYPPSLKRRVGGDWGHLANHAAAEILHAVAHAGLNHVACAHLSKQNNSPALAQAALAAVLGCASDEVLVASQATGLPWLDC
jgi:phosphoribosyl 1,2-cyclic phosphodiesterase